MQYLHPKRVEMKKTAYGQRNLQAIVLLNTYPLWKVRKEEEVILY